LPPGQLHDAGADKRRQRRDQQKYRKARDPDPNSGGRQEFDVAEAKALNFSENEIELSQQKKDRSDRRTLACSRQTGRWTADQKSRRQPQSRNREIQPVRNDSVADVDPGEDGAKQA